MGRYAAALRLVLAFVASAVLPAAIAQPAAQEDDCWRPEARFTERQIAGCSQVLQRDPGAADAMLNRADAYVWLRGDFEKAIVDALKALDKGLTAHGQAIAFSHLGLAYLGQHRYQAAITAFDESIRLSTEKIAIPLVGRGVARIRTGDAARARADFARAEASSPGVLKTWSVLWGRLDKAIALAPSQAGPGESTLPARPEAECKALAAQKEKIGEKVVNRYVESELLAMGCPGRYTPLQR